MLRRLQKMRTTSTPVHDTIQLDAGLSGVWLAPVYGAIFAKVLAMVFMGQMLDSLIGVTGGGAAGPSSGAGGSAPPSLFPHFLPNSILPASGADYAKIMVWSFIAGFAEKFVPDVLDRITAKGRAAEEGCPATVERTSEALCPWALGGVSADNRGGRAAGRDGGADTVVGVRGGGHNA